MEIRVLAYNEGKFIISKDLTDESIKGRQVEINIAPVLKYREEDNVIGAQLNVDYSVEGKTALFLGVVVSVYVENIKEILKDSDDNQKKQELKPVWEIVLGMVRGVLAEKTQNTPLKNQLLPLVDLDAFSNYTMFVKEE